MRSHSTPAGRRRFREPRLLLAVALMMITGGGACNKVTPPAVATKLALPDSAEQVVFGMVVRLTDLGVSKGRLISDTGFIYSDANGKRFEFRRVHATFYDAQGIEDGTMTSREGTQNERLSRIEVRGNVIVQRKGGDHLETPQLVYDQSRNQIFSDSSFVLTKPNKQVMSGIGFESDPRLTTFRCLRACKGTAPVRVPR